MGFGGSEQAAGWRVGRPSLAKRCSFLVISVVMNSVRRGQPQPLKIQQGLILVFVELNFDGAREARPKPGYEPNRGERMKLVD